MLTLLEVASGAAPFGAWVKYAESPESRQEKIEPLLRTLYSLLDDVLLLQQGAGAYETAACGIGSQLWPGASASRG